MILQASESGPGKPIGGTDQAIYLTKEVSADVTVSYMQYFPKDYDKKDKWPLLLFLHGAGERGTNLNQVKVHGPPKLAAEGKLDEFIVVSPQCPSNDYWNRHGQITNLIALLDHMEEKYKVDSDRIYVTGLSMGGFGTWQLATTLSDRIAAAVPICGGSNWANSFVLAQTQMPIWAFHGDADSVVPVELTTDMIDQIQKIGGNAKVTIYPGVGHDSWTETYNNPELYKWLLSHKLSDR